VNSAAGVGGHEALVTSGRTAGHHRGAVGCKLVDAGQPYLAAGRRSHQLPRRHRPGLCPDHEGAVAVEELQERDRRAACPGGHRLGPAGRVPIPEVVADHLAARRPGEEIVAAAVERQRGDVTVGLDAECPERFLPSRRADQSLLLHDALDDQVPGTKLGDDDGPVAGCGAGQPQDRPAALGVDDRPRPERGARLEHALALLELDQEADACGDETPVRRAEQVLTATDLGRRRHARAAQIGDRDRRIGPGDPQRRELHRAVGGDRKGDLAVFVHAEGVAGHRHGAGHDRPQALGRGWPEQRPHLGQDHEQDGENRGDDDDAAEHDQARRPPVEQDPASRPGPRDDQGAPAQCLGVDRHLQNLVGLFLGHRGRNREVAVLDDRLLPFPGQHQTDELADERVDRLAGRLVDVDVEKAR
jgi:hypothetical protein